MIQDIHPNLFHNEYVEKTPNEDSFILCFNENNILLNNSKGKIYYPKYSDFSHINATYIYLFKIDEKEFFLAQVKIDIEINNFSFENISLFRTAVPKYNAFAGITAYHLNCWYKNNKYCGRCGHELIPDDKERMMYCEDCRNMVYPKISPAVIVAITHGDKLLLTKYAGREYKKHALVAGFIEIGETPEEAVKREVMEEVGVKVKNIRYYKSQPWGFSESLLIGYFAELDGDSLITMDESELSEAIWIKRDEIEIEYDGLSLTNEMICKFKDNM
ncbi:MULTISPECIES: NAD(+) diphosphatase [Clostridium]|uniref:NAD(+) diphosphatase n=1 Tax=Clostridium cibarium TaxID=2762247 RepID=A0ABR8PYG6_9CLOT|nr:MULTISPECIES: NAD(+) diphosphatase [Clostridium]MBD7913177.1 NAD(+) diphosphatase [Clostridium cibarium]